MKIRFGSTIGIAFSAAVMAFIPCVHAADTDELALRAQQTVSLFQQKYPGWAASFQSSAGYAVFPTVSEGALGVGVARGKGLVYRHGQVIGQATLTKASVGAQIGGESYSEMIFFETRRVLHDFQAGNYELSASASAVAAYEGAGRAINFNQGVAVVIFDRTGALAKAAIGGQKFGYQPLTLNSSYGGTSGGAVGGSASGGASGGNGH